MMKGNSRISYTFLLFEKILFDISLQDYDFSFLNKKMNYFFISIFNIYFDIIGIRERKFPGNSLMIYKMTMIWKMILMILKMN